MLWMLWSLTLARAVPDVCDAYGLPVGSRPLDTAPRTMFGRAPGGAFGRAVAAGDFNGDGHLDVAVGAPEDDAAGASAGAVWLFFGPLDAGLDLAAWHADAVWLGEGPGARGGAALTNAGDMNGDGADELVIGSPGGPGTAVPGGAVYLVVGDAALGGMLAALPAWYGGAAGDGLGTSVAGVGDVNGDGLADLLVGAPGADVAGRVDAGAAHLLYGPWPAVAGPDASFAGEVAQGRFGRVVAGAGDLDGDGRADLAVGAPDRDRASIFLGRLFPARTWATAADLTLTGAVGGRLGEALASAGDEDHDGLDDLWLGETGGAGRAWLVRGGLGGGTRAVRAVADAFVDVASAGGLGGAALAAGFDVDADGHGDLLVGAPRAAGLVAGAGSAWALRGPFVGARSVREPFALRVGGLQAGALTGAALAAGDLNEDGFSDLFVGGPLADGGPARRHGRVSVFFGGADTTDALLVYADHDADGHGDPANAARACVDPALVQLPDDCDDADAGVHPGASERCDGRDEDCDGRVDEGADEGRPAWFVDADGDGAGDPATRVEGCAGPAGWVDNGLDCDDARADLRPGQPEVCDTLDNDCDGARYLGGEVPLARAWATLSYPGALAVTLLGDQDGDGRAELVAADAASGQVWVVAGLDAVGALALTGSRPSGEPVARTTLLGAAGVGAFVAAGDLDGDGVGDLVVAGPADVSVFFGPLPAGALHAADAGLVLTSSPRGLALGDLDGDGADDLVVREPARTTVVYGGPALRAAGTRAAPDAQVSGATEAIATADLNDDGRDELVLAQGGGLSLVWGDVARPATPATSRVEGPGDPTFGASLARVGDVGGDGVDDLLIGGGAGEAWLLSGLRAGAGSFADMARGLVGGASLAAGAAGDVDGDGLADLLLADAAGAGAVWLLYGEAALTLPSRGDVPLDRTEGFGRVAPGTTSPVISAANQRGPEGAVVRGSDPAAALGSALAGGADLDGDGRDDVVVASSTGVVVLRGGPYGVDNGADRALYYWDDDADGYANEAGDSFLACPMHVPVEGVALRGILVSTAPPLDDCDDQDPAVHPGAAVEDCDAVEVLIPPATGAVTLSPATLYGHVAATASAQPQDEQGGALPFTWRWRVDGVEVDGAVSASLDPRYFDRGQTVTAEAVVVNRSRVDVLSASVVVANAPPTLNLCSSLPGTITVNDAPRAVPVGLLDEDPADQGRLTATVRWQQRVGPVWVDIAGATGPTLASCASRYVEGGAPNCSGGTQLRALCTPSDGTTAGAPVASPSVVVRNTAPVITSCTADTGTVFVGAEVHASATAVDPEHDPVTISLFWQRGGADVPGATGPMLTVDQLWMQWLANVRCVATDAGGLSSPSVFAFGPYVVNRPPPAPVVTLGPAAPTSEDLLIGAYEPVVDPDGQSVWYVARWSKNGVPIVGPRWPLDPMPTAPSVRGDVWTLEVLASDGWNEVWSAPASVTLVNTPPRADAVQLWPLDLRAGVPVRASAVGLRDADGDPVTVAVAWQVNGVAVASVGDTLDPALFRRGDVVVATVTPSDGFGAGEAVASAPLVVANTAPTPPVVRISPSAPTDADALTCAVITPPVDVDGDVVALTWSWTVDGALVPGATTATLPAAMATTGQVVRCEVEATDGALSSALASSLEVAIQDPANPPAPVISPPPTFSNLTAHTLSGACDAARCAALALACDDGAAVDVYAPVCAAGAFSQVIAADRGLTTSCAATCALGGGVSAPSNVVAVTVVDPADPYETAGGYGDRADLAVAEWPAMGDGVDLVVSGNILDEWGDRADWLRLRTTDNAVADAASGQNRYRFDVSLIEGEADYDLWVWRTPGFPEHPATGPYDAYTFDVTDRGDAPNHALPANLNACAAPGSLQLALYNQCESFAGTWWVQVVRDGPDTGAAWSVAVATGER